MKFDPVALGFPADYIFIDDVLHSGHTGGIPEENRGRDFPPPSNYGLTTVNPYRSVYECKGKNKYGNKCGKIFTSEKSASKHMRKNPLHTGKMEKRDVNGAYIRERRDRCHTEHLIFKCDQGHTFEAPNSCFIRDCPKCERTRRARISKKDLASINGMKNPKFLTLTWAGHHGLGIKGEIEKHVRNFIRRLRRIDDNLQYVRVFEIKKKEDGYYWHCHFVVDMMYVRQATLSDMWREITGHSYIVDIRAVGRMNKRSIIQYISKYIAKPIENLSDIDYALHVYRQRFHDARLHLIPVQYSPTCSCSICDRPMKFDKSEAIEPRQIETPPPPLISYC